MNNQLVGLPLASDAGYIERDIISRSVEERKEKELRSIQTTGRRGVIG